MKYYLLIVVLALFIGNVNAQYVSLNSREILKLKDLGRQDAEVKKYISSFKKKAEEALSQEPNPIDTVISEGHLATDPKKIITQQALKDIEKMYALAITYRMSNEKTYLNKLETYLTAWATINQPQGNPINDTKFEDLFGAYDLVKNDIAGAKAKVINNWLLKMANEEIRTGKNKKKTTSFNNWNSHRLKVIGCIGYLLNDAELKKYIDEELPVQIEKNLLPDGSGFDFLERDALHYHVYTLEPLIKLAAVVKRAGSQDFYNYTAPSGASISKSVDFLIPYVTGEKTHGEYVNSKVAFDRKRAENKEKGFEIGANFKPEYGIPVLFQAAYFEPSITAMLTKITGQKKFYNWEAVINVLAL